MKEAYLQSFKDQAVGRAAGPLDVIRGEGIEAFNVLGYPSIKAEDWKYTSVAALAKLTFQVGSPLATPDADWKKYSYAHAGFSELVFLNGRFSPELSNLTALPKGVVVDSVASILRKRPELLQNYLAQYSGTTEDGFKALNTALFSEGAFIQLPGDAVAEMPIHLLFISTRNDSAVNFLRNIIVADSGSQVKILESYVGSSGVYFNNAVTQVFLAENAQVEHFKIQRENIDAYHMGDLRVHQGRNSVFRSSLFSLGGLLARNETKITLDGEGSECSLLGLYGARGKQLVDNLTLVDHAKPHCKSNEFYKGVLDDSSRGIFNGKILVRQDAQKTSAEQANKNLLLSKDATANTRPQLQIYANDVKCTHGATVGQLDAEALFYLRSRGIDETSAKRILSRAFASDILDQMGIETVRKSANQLFEGWLEAV